MYVARASVRDRLNACEAVVKNRLASPALSEHLLSPSRVEEPQSSPDRSVDRLAGTRRARLRRRR